MSDRILLAKYRFTSYGFFIFVQRWNELFNNNTIDSYQFHVLNSHWLIGETLDVIALVKDGTIHYANLPPLINEAMERIKNDICLKKHILPFWGRLISNLTKTPKADDKPSLIRLEYQLKHAKSCIYPKYLDWLLTDLKEAIDCDKLEEIDILTGQIASELVNSGWSPRSLLRLVNHVCFPAGQGSINVMWRDFLQAIATPVQTCPCYYPCKGNITMLSNANVVIKKGSSIILEHPYASAISPTTDYIYVESSSRYYDLHSAVENSKPYMSKIQALIGYNKTDISIDNSIIVLFPGVQKCVPYNIHDTSLKSTARVDHPYFITIASLNEIFNSTKIQSNDQAKLINLLKQYNLGLETLSPESAFTNLWIALESFVVNGQYKSIIEQVKKLVPSILCSTYVYHLLKNFLNDCARCGVSPEYHGVSINVSRANVHDVSKLLNVLRNPIELIKLLTLCSKYTLLHIRCTQLAKYMRSNNSVLNLMENHYNNISWHIQRLYRVRNALVHSSESAINLLPLTAHLNSYLRSIVAQVVYRLGTDNYHSLGELFSAFEDNYLAIAEILKDKTPPYENELVLKGALF